MEGITISGTITTLESGLLSGEITSSSDLTRISTGDVFYAYEVTNEVIVIGAGPANGQVIMILPALSNIAPSAGSGEAIMIAPTDWANLLMAYMTTEITGSSSYTFNINVYDLTGEVLEVTVETDYSFTGNRLYKTDEQPQAFVSPRGMFAGIIGKKDGTNWMDGGFAGAMYDSTVSTSEIADGSRCYIGMAFDRVISDNSTNVRAISVESYSPTLLKVSLMDVSSGAAIGAPMGIIEVGLMNNPSQGIIDALCERDGITVPVKMVAYKYATDKYAVCGFTTLESGPVSFFIIEQEEPIL